MTLKAEKELNQYVDLYEKKLERNMSANTIVHYMSDINQFVKYIVDKGLHKNFAELKQDDYLDYIDYLKGKGMAAATIERKAFATNGFLNWLNKTGRLKKAMFEDNKELREYLPVKKAKSVKSLTKDQIRELTFKTDNLMEECIIRLAFDTAMRVSELIEAKWEDIEYDGKRYSLTVLGKGRGGMSKERSVLIRPKTMEKLNELKASREWDSKYIIESERTKKPISARRVNQILDKVAERCGIDNLSSHVFRKSIATQLLENGTDIVYVSDYLGHSSIETTKRNYVDTKRSLHAEIDQNFGEEI